MIENQTELNDQLSVQGSEWSPKRGSGVQRDVQEALDTDLDAYLDRELFTAPTGEVTLTPGVEKPAERLQGVLALAAEEEQWLRAKPGMEQSAENSKDLDGEECEIPEHLKVKPAPEVSPAPPADQARFENAWSSLPGLAVAPHLAQQGWNLPVAPAPVAQSRTPWLVTGALAGVSAASVLVAAMVWMHRDSLPSRAQVMSAYVPAGTVAAAAPLPATPVPEPVLSVKDSPLLRQPETLLVDWSTAAGGAVETLPGPVVLGRVTITRETTASAPVPTPAPQSEPVAGAVAQAAVVPEPKATPGAAAIAHSVQVPALGEMLPGGKAVPSEVRSSEPAAKAEALKPREKVQAPKVAAVEEPQARLVLEDPTLANPEEEEIPFMPQPVAAQAPVVVAKAAPAEEASSKSDDGAEFDEEFARKLGFTKDSVQKGPKPTGVTSVWIPPDPASSLPEALTPQEIQQVVLANQPAITSCIQRHKEAIPGLNGGKFVVRWFVLPSGSTQQIAMETPALKGTALASCIQDLVREWKFPMHRTQMGPIRFPFIF